MSVLHVVSGVAIRHMPAGVLILMGKRKLTTMRPDLWELPGGKVEADETPRHALQREWREELGIEISVGTHITTAVLELDRTLVIDLFRVHDDGMSGFDGVRALDHSELRWMNLRAAMEGLPCSPGFYLHWKALAAFVAAGHS